MVGEARGIDPTGSRLQRQNDSPLFSRMKLRVQHPVGGTSPFVALRKEGRGSLEILPCWESKALLSSKKALGKCRCQHVGVKRRVWKGREYLSS